MRRRLPERGGDKPEARGEFLLYTAEDGLTRIDCRFDGQTLWLTQAQIAERFQTTPQNITLHLKAILADGELDEAATCKDYLQVRLEGAREIKRNLRHYRLEAILAAGYLLGIENPSHVTRDPLRGGLFENMVIADLLKTRLNQGSDPGLFYLRDDKGFEIDLLIKQGRSLIPIEIKSAMIFNPDFIKPTRVFCERDQAARAPALIYTGEALPDVHGIRCVNYRTAYALFDPPTPPT